MNIAKTAELSSLATLGENVTIDNFSIIEDNVIIGNNVKIGPFCIIKQNAVIGDDCVFSAYCEIRTNVLIGKNSTFGSRCTICANTTIGANVTVKYGFVTTTLDFESNIDLPAGSVGDKSMIGANVILMPGAKIGSRCMIGACSQVRDIVPDEEIWFGNPAKFYKKVEKK